MNPETTPTHLGHELRELMQLLYKPHPWHGISAGPEAPATVQAYIELVPTDAVKYEIDKASGHLKVDRPQLFSSFCPSLYGFIPRTYCGTRVGRHTAASVGRDEISGDGDPIDICVLTEKPITHGDVLVPAIPIGGIRLIDKNQADDKIIAVMVGDRLYGDIKDIADLKEAALDRLVHYFLTYKDLPSPTRVRKVEIAAVYGRNEAMKIIEHSMQDYAELFRDPAGRWERLLAGLAGTSDTGSPA